MKVSTFGECLFRFSTHKGERLSRAQNLNFYLGGTELNIAANLASLGIETQWISGLADGLTGELIKERIKQLGVKTTHCWTIPQGKAGWYLVDSGSSPRPDVVFNRNASSLAEEKSFHLDWNMILASSQIFHTSGVTAGLSTVLTQEVKKAMQAAREQKALVSYDFNYRKNIWSIEEFIKRQKDLLPLIDILFCAESDLELFFGKKQDSSDYSSIFKQTSLKQLVINQRSADENEYGLKVVIPDHVYTSKKYQIQNIDRIGVGDSMAAGYLAGFLKSQDLQQACEWGALAGAMKYGIAGDMALVSEKELTTLLDTGPKAILR